MRGQRLRAAAQQDVEVGVLEEPLLRLGQQEADRVRTPGDQRAGVPVHDVTRPADGGVDRLLGRGADVVPAVEHARHRAPGHTRLARDVMNRRRSASAPRVGHGHDFTAPDSEIETPETLDDQEQRDQRDDREQCAGDHQRVQRRGVGALFEEREQTERDRELLVVAEHDVRQQEVVPHRHELEQEHGHQTGHHHRQRDPGEDPPLARAVHPPGLDHVTGHGRGGVDPGEIDAVRGEDEGQQHGRVGVRQVRLRQQQVLGDREDHRRHQHTRHQNAEDGLAAPEAVHRERVAADRRDGRRQEGAETGVQGRVAHPLPVDAVAVGVEIPHVLGEAGAGQEGEGGEQLAARLGGRDHHPGDGQQTVERAEQQRQRRDEGDPAAQRRPLGGARGGTRGRCGLTQGKRTHRASSCLLREFAARRKPKDRTRVTTAMSAACAAAE